MINSRSAGLLLQVVAVAGAAALGGTPVPAVAQNALDQTEAMVEEGANIYRSRCARCHGRNGEGQQHSHDSAPRLSGSFARLSVGEIAVQVIRGGAYMPPFGSLTDREIAAVTTYVRTAFGNDFGLATPDEIAAYR